MGFAVERNGYTNVRELGFAVITDLVAHGFEVEAVDKVQTNSFSVASSLYQLRPTLAVDPLFEDVQQPWRLIMEFNETIGYINAWALTPLQITDALEPARYDVNREAGRMSLDNNSLGTTGDHWFWNRNPGQTKWSCFQNAVDDEAIPLSYQLVITDHGVFFMMWAESFDSSGDCFAWFNIQRPVDCNTGAIVTGGKSPVIALFSQSGISNNLLLNNITDPLVYNSIQMFTVRESDVNMPTPPASAVIPTADNLPVINPVQQVCIAESQNFVLRFPKGFSTDRYLYDYQLDQIAYTSSDVLSTDSTPTFSVFNEATNRKYKALKANFPENKGMRLLCQVEGISIDVARPVPDTDPPVITVIGDNPIDVEQGTVYTDQGATALDDVDGDVTPSIITTGADLVDTSTIGASFTVTYDVTDAAGNAAIPATRTVNIIAPAGP